MATLGERVGHKRARMSFDIYIEGFSDLVPIAIGTSVCTNFHSEGAPATEESQGADVRAL